MLYTIAFFLCIASANFLLVIPTSIARADCPTPSSNSIISTVLQKPRFLYVGCPQSGTLLIYGISVTGGLRLVGTVHSKPLSESWNGFSDGWRPTAPAVTGRLVYSIDGDTLFQYHVDDVGLPQPLTPSTVSLSNSPFCLTVAPDGSNVYALHYEPGNIIHLTSVPDGTLTRLPDVVQITSSPDRIVLDPTDRFAYVSIDGTTQTDRYRVGGNGVLDSDSPRSFTMGGRGFQDDGGSSLITFTPDGKFVYDVSKNTIFQYRVLSNGVLKALSPRAVVRAADMYFPLVMAPKGQYAYAVNSDNSITEFQIGIDGKLSAIGSLAATPLWHSLKGYRAILMDINGEFAYITSPQQHLVVRYRVANNGTLITPLVVLVPGNQIPETLAMVQE